MKNTPLYRVVLYVLDLNQEINGPANLKVGLEHDIPFSRVTDVRVTDVGPWEDDHQLNQTTATEKDFEAHFAEIGADEGDIWLKQEHNRVRNIMMAQIAKNSTLEQENRRLREEIEKMQEVKKLISTIKGM